MKKTDEKKKLKLSKETLRTLGDKDLSRVAGGVELSGGTQGHLTCRCIAGALD